MGRASGPDLPLPALVDDWSESIRAAADRKIAAFAAWQRNNAYPNAERY